MTTTADEHPDRYSREVSPGLVLAVDASNCIVLRSDRPVHTITNVERLTEMLETMHIYQAIEDSPVDRECGHTWTSVYGPEPDHLHRCAKPYRHGHEHPLSEFLALHECAACGAVEEGA